jgi:hypothetical protein
MRVRQRTRRKRKDFAGSANRLIGGFVLRKTRQSGDWRSRKNISWPLELSGLFILAGQENIGVFVGVGEDWRRETSGLRNALSYKCEIRFLRCAKIRR